VTPVRTIPPIPSSSSLNIFADTAVVSWKWGSGKPSGVVEEVKTSGQLEIETAGKKVRKNADEDNPAVHVAREGNDVVKRASELTKESDGEDVEVKDREKEKEEEEKVKEKKEEKEGEKELSGKSAGEKRDRNDAVEEDGEAAAVEQETHAAVEEQEGAEKEIRKEAKKPKLGTDEEKLSEEKEKKRKTSLLKKKAGRVAPKAKKSEDSKPAVFHDTPAARTRSKATA
jgi:hypothetical protein